MWETVTNAGTAVRQWAVKELRAMEAYKKQKTTTIMLVSIQQQWPKIIIIENHSEVSGRAAINLFQFDFHKPWNYLLYFYKKAPPPPLPPYERAEDNAPAMPPFSGVPGDHSTAMICFVQKCNWLCCNVCCHVFGNRQRRIEICKFMMLANYIFRQISAKFLLKTKASLLWRLSFRMGRFARLPPRF